MEKIPPQNLDAEKSLLGSLLIDQDGMIKVADMLRSDDFYSKTHETIYDSIVHLYANHEPVDILSLGNRLEEIDKLKETGGRAYLVELSNAVPTSAHIEHYAKIVQKKASLRRLIRAATGITKLGHEEESDIDTTLDAAERTLFTVSQTLTKNAFVPISRVLSEAFDRIDELHRDRGKLRGVPTGYRELDDLLAGLQKSDLLILAARPSVGKTSLAMNIAT